MPIIRYVLRNEYGHSDPLLYGPKVRDYPEACLEGVAMAGLVGLLRQLGDLAEFAAEVFHGLQEEVKTTAAKGHSLMLRVRQVETEFPEVEKMFLSEPNNFTRTVGIKWHHNHEFYVNVITRGQMPRLLLQSYKECRAPPRFFLLDKFDSAGEGACLKRYSDPSVFKAHFAFSREIEQEVHEEERTNIAKFDGSRWRNGETPEHLDPKLQLISSEKALDSVPTKRIKLKRRPLSNLNKRIKASYMECVLGRHSFDWENLENDSSFKLKSIDSSEFDDDMDEFVTDSQFNNSVLNQEEIQGYTNMLEKHTIMDNAEESWQIPSDEVEKSSQTLRNVAQVYVESESSGISDGDGASESERSTSQEAEEEESLYDAEGGIDGIEGDYVCDKTAGELDNCMDALTTMGLETEIDSDSRYKQELIFLKMKYQEMHSDENEEEQDLQDLASQGRSTLSNGDLMSNLSDSPSFQENENHDMPIDNSVMDASLSLPLNLGTDSGGTQDLTSEVLPRNIMVMEMESPENILLLDIHSSMSVVKEALSNSSTKGPDSSPANFSPQVSLDEFLSDSGSPSNICSDCVSSTYDCTWSLNDCSPLDSLDEVQSDFKYLKGISSDQPESNGEIAKHLDDDLYHLHSTPHESILESASAWKFEDRQPPQPVCDEENANRLIKINSKNNNVESTLPMNNESLHLENSLVHVPINGLGTGVDSIDRNTARLRSEIVLQHSRDVPKSDDLVPTGNHSSLPCGSAVSASTAVSDSTVVDGLPIELRIGLMERTGKIEIENAEHDSSAPTFSEEASDTQVNLQEGCTLYYFLLSQHELECSDTSNPKNSTVLASRQTYNLVGSQVEENEDNVNDKERSDYVDTCLSSQEYISKAEVVVSEQGGVEVALQDNNSEQNLFHTQLPIYTDQPEQFPKDSNSSNFNELKTLPVECQLGGYSEPFPRKTTRNEKLLDLESSIDADVQTELEEPKPELSGMPLQNIPHAPSLEPVEDGCLVLEGEKMLPLAEEERCHNETTALNAGKTKHTPLCSSIVAPSVEDENILNGQEVSRKGLLQRLNQFAPSPTSAPSLEGNLISPSKYPVPFPTFKSHKPEDEDTTSQIEHVHSASIMKDTRAQKVFFTPGGEIICTPKLVALPAMDAEKVKWKPHSIRDRPRDPLMESVASHDKSMLRKDSLTAPTLTKPKVDGMDSLLEQIRNKSFHLKPAATIRPNIKGPVTNLKLAAILEKANTIRQAYAGSDEDDDDAWE